MQSFFCLNGGHDCRNLLYFLGRIRFGQIDQINTRRQYGFKVCPEVFCAGRIDSHNEGFSALQSLRREQKSTQIFPRLRLARFDDSVFKIEGKSIRFASQGFREQLGAGCRNKEFAAHGMSPFCNVLIFSIGKTIKKIKQC